MSLSGANIENVELAKSRVPEAAVEKTGLHELDEKRLSSDVVSASLPQYDEDGETRHADHPTDEELATLRRVSGKIPWTAYTVAIVEFCERFSYYGTTAVCKLLDHPLERSGEILTRYAQSSTSSRSLFPRDPTLVPVSRASLALLTWASVRPLD